MTRIDCQMLLLVIKALNSLYKLVFAFFKITKLDLNLNSSKLRRKRILNIKINWGLACAKVARPKRKNQIEHLCVTIDNHVQGQVIFPGLCKEGGYNTG